VPTEDDEEIEYGKWYVHTADTALAEANKLCPVDEEGNIWPHWGEGRPTKLRRLVMEPQFTLGNVSYQDRYFYETVEYLWSGTYLLSVLKDKYHLLPSARYKSQWSGVYRIFSPNTNIGRSCGQDSTGTLYVGKAGTAVKNWSILRNRIQAIVNERHHATNNWNHPIRQRFPWSSLAIEWAYTGEKLHQGKPIPEAGIAESFLLLSYRDSFGELPPWNEKI
jgi:hypothetical protein